MAYLILTLLLVSANILMTLESDDDEKEKPIDWHHWEKVLSKKADATDKWSDLEMFASRDKRRGGGGFWDNRNNRRNLRKKDTVPIDWKKWEQAFDKSKGKNTRRVRTTRPTMSPRELEVQDWLRRTPLEDHNRAYYESWVAERRKRRNISDPEQNEGNEEEYEDYGDQEIDAVNHVSDIERNIIHRKKRSPKKVNKWNLTGIVPTAPGVSLFYKKKNKKRALRVKYRSHIEMAKYLEKLEKDKKHKEEADAYFKKINKEGKGVEPEEEAELVYSITSEPESVSYSPEESIELSVAEERQFLEIFLNGTPAIGEDLVQMKVRWSEEKAIYMRSLKKQMRNRTTKRMATHTSTINQIVKEGSNHMTIASISRTTPTVPQGSRLLSTASTVSKLHPKGPPQSVARVSKKMRFCPICGWSFRGKFRLTQHIKSESCLRRPQMKDYLQARWKKTRDT